MYVTVRIGGADPSNHACSFVAPSPGVSPYQKIRVILYDRRVLGAFLVAYLTICMQPKGSGDCSYVRVSVTSFHPDLGIPDPGIGRNLRVPLRRRES